MNKLTDHNLSSFKRCKISADETPVVVNYNPSQARGQAGSRQGGQFIKQPGGGGSSIHLAPLRFGSHEPGGAPGGQPDAHQARFRREGLVKEAQGGVRVIEKGHELANHVHGNAKLAKPTKLQQMKIEAMNPNGLVGGKVKIPWEMVHQRQGNKYLTVPEKKAELKAMFPHHDVEFPAYKAAKSLGMNNAPVLVMKNPPPPKTSIKEGDRKLEDARQPSLSKVKNLTDAKPTSVIKLGGGVNGSYIMHLENGVRGVWKPRGEEATNMRGNIPNKTSYAREAAAYSVAKVIGLQDLVPPTIERTVKFSFGKLEGPEQKGSFQLFFDGKDGSKIAGASKYDGDKDLARASAFDILCNNTDRHHKNWMIENGGSKKLALIDHGLAFPTTHSGMRSWLLNEAASRHLKVPQEVLGWNGDKIADAMRKHGLDEGAVLVMRERLEMLHKAATNNRGFVGLRSKTNAQDY